MVRAWEIGSGPGLLITDVAMPRVGGRALATSLRQKPFAADTLLERVEAAPRGQEPRDTSPEPRSRRGRNQLDD